MKKIASILLASLAFSASVSAILPPLYHTSNEIKAILVNPEFGQKLHSGEMIESIQRNEDGYLVTTNQHTMQVHVKYLPSERPGPAQFDLQFDEPVSTR